MTTLPQVDIEEAVRLARQYASADGFDIWKPGDFMKISDALLHLHSRLSLIESAGDEEVERLLADAIEEAIDRSFVVTHGTGDPGEEPARYRLLSLYKALKLNRSDYDDLAARVNQADAISKALGDQVKRLFTKLQAHGIDPR